jgi:cob(I)alamin adenosyltransferase
VDEAQAVLGLARASGCSAAMGKILLAIERDLYLLMAELAAAGQDDSPFAGSVTSAHVEQLEKQIGDLEECVEMPRGFVIPGDTQVGAALHLARTVVRRAERRAVHLVHEGLLHNEQVVRYLNRLSSLLFICAQVEDRAATEGDLTMSNGVD